LKVFLPRPEDCPRELYDLMRECWRRDERDRPTFREIRMFLQRKSLGYRPPSSHLLLPSSQGLLDGAAASGSSGCKRDDDELDLEATALTSAFSAAAELSAQLEKLTSDHMDLVKRGGEFTDDGKEEADGRLGCDLTSCDTDGTRRLIGSSPHSDVGGQQ
jgi:hypothetical protein